MESFYFTIYGLIFCILLIVVYFSKKKVKNLENKLYSIIIASSFFSCLAEVWTYILVVQGVESYAPIYLLALKLLFVGFLSWIFFFTLYIFVITIDNNKDEKSINKLLKRFILYYAFTLLIVFILPITVTNTNGLLLPTGPSVTAIYLTVALCTLAMFGIFFKNIRNAKNKKFVPLYILIIMFMVSFIVQKLFPSLLTINATLVFTTFVMYFTIENPDIKIINELNKNRLLVNRANEEKSNFLFLASTQIREPISNIENLSNIKNDANDLKKKMMEINNNAHTLSFLVNDIMNISSLSNSNIKVIPNKYSLVNLVEKIRLIKEKEIHNDVEFRINLSKIIPEYLYGDSKLIEQVLLSILNNAIKYTNKGFIELTINAIVKYDMCRLVITVADSGNGIPIDKVNDLLMVDEPLNNEDLKRLETKNVDINTIKKIVNKLGGYFTIKSEIDKGTEIKIVLDQKIDTGIQVSVDKVLNNEKVLIASSNMSFIKNITGLIIKKGYDVENSIYANDVLDRIRVGQEFSYIFLDDMLDIRALEVLRKLKKNPKFKTPVIVMLDSDTEFIKEHFVKDGFTDYLLKSDLGNEINRILK